MHDEMGVMHGSADKVLDMDDALHMVQEYNDVVVIMTALTCTPGAQVL